MSELWGLIKFIFVLVIICAIIGGISVVTCARKMSSAGSYQYTSPPSVDIDLPEKKETNKNMTLQISSIRWRSLNNNLKNKIVHKEICAIMYFTSSGCCETFESTTLSDRNVINTINNKFTPIKITNSDIASKMQITETPSLIIFSPSSSRRISGEISSSSLLSILESTGC